MKRKITAWTIVGIILIILAAVYAVSWFLIPGWKGIPGGMWILAGLVIVGVFSVLNDIFGILEKIGFIGKDNKGEKKEPVQHIEGDVIQQGGVNAVATSITGGEFIGTKNVYEAPIAPSVLPPRLHQLPAPPKDFTGRELEIEKIIQDLSESKGAAIIGLTGMGGVGKTVLGLVVAHKIAQNYPDAQIFIDLKGSGKNPLPTIDALKHVILSFEPQADLRSLNEQQIEDFYRSILSDKKALLFLDNAHDAVQVKHLLPPASCAVLVTSRRHFTLPGLQPLRLEVMTENDAISLLLELCPRIKDHASEIVKLCACLPIAIRIAGSFLSTHPDWSPVIYIAKLVDRHKRITTLKSADDQELNVEAAFSLSYDQLADEDQSRWRKLAIFPASFRGDAAAEVWSLEEDPARTLLSELRRYSLVEYHEETERYGLHDLLADFVDARLTQDERTEAGYQLAQHYLKVLGLANQMYLEGGEKVLQGLMLFDLEWLNIQTGHIWAVLGGKGNKQLLELCRDYPIAGVFVLDLRLDNYKLIEWLEIELDACRILDDRGSEVSALGNLGNAYNTLGNTRKAIEFHEQALNIAREIGDRRNEGATLGSLGVAYAALGDARQAIEYYEKHLMIAHEIGDRRNEGSALGNLGNAYYTLGYSRKAIEFHEQALKIDCEIGDRRGEGNTLGNLGLAYAALGDDRKAIEYYEQALKIAREIGDRRGEGNTLGNLGNAYNNLGNIHKSIECHEKELVIAREIGDRYGEGGALGNLGSAYYNLGVPRKAKEYHEQALMIDREIGGRRGEGQDLCNLGNAYFTLGDIRKAFEYYEQALEIDREIGDRRGEGAVLGNLGNAYFTLRYARKAIEYYEQALEIDREIDDRRGEGNALGNLGLAYAALGNARKAIEYYEKNLEITREIGDRHTEGNTLGNLGSAYAGLGENKSAQELFQQALVIFEEIGSPHVERVRQMLEKLKK